MKQDLDDVEVVINACSGGTLVVLDQAGLLLSRSWCLFEIWATMRLKGCEMLHWLVQGKCCPLF